MTTFFLTGHRTFGNRGCEAIVRSTVAAIQKLKADTTFLVPSTDVALDGRQWPRAFKSGVNLVPAYDPRHERYWVHLQRLPFPFLKRAGWPFPMPRWLKEMIGSADAVLSVGGDNYSLDYRLPSLLMGMDQLARELGKPNILWGASVGPFEAEPAFLPEIKRHLANFNMIAVREALSREYLSEGLELPNVMQMVDPAFGLAREPITADAFWPAAAPNGALGVNVSPLIERYKQPGQEIRLEVIGFIRKAVEEYGLNVLLIPHVIPLDGAKKNNDADYMAPILKATADLGSSVAMSPSNLNAAQIKDVIAKLRFFVGARTHATIAALSSGVPTISIAYSAKARGINLDLFGHADAVLPTPSVTAAALELCLQYLIDNEGTLKLVLAERMPAYKQQINAAAATVLELLSA